MDCVCHTEFNDTLLYYISGAIVAKLIKDIKSKFCKECVLGKLDKNRSVDIYCPEYDENEPAALTSFINNSGLRIHSISTFRIIQYAEKVF